MSGSSVFRNPTSTHGDRELPELCANGTTVSAVGESMSGTSFSAPAVAGITAVLQSVDATLKSWPEGCRAILMASRRDATSPNGTWWERRVEPPRDARRRCRCRRRRGRGARSPSSAGHGTRPGVQRGWDVGTLSLGDFGGDRLLDVHATG